METSKDQNSLETDETTVLLVNLLKYKLQPERSCHMFACTGLEEANSYCSGKTQAAYEASQC